ncbi:trifunctional hydroxymethylpyrimidine kinase/phosphomethylpyrimidine kinase/thiaminase [Coemansia sp. RSA 988]|nr:trifunctional hydroxymethylpyrimidine kinase/phosphomethylpyrimidine kinase/thiaminase [Coemansia sp. RSA 988]
MASIQEQKQRPPPAVLTIAGSDSGGGAGIQADLKTFMAHETYGLSVITAITAQNTLEVRSSVRVSPEMVTQQLDTVMADIDVRAAKLGMLADAQIIEAVVESWTRAIKGLSSPPPLVIDPVMVATSGERLLDENAMDALRDKLLPLANIVTPNLREAETILELAAGSIDSIVAMEKAAEQISKRFDIAITIVKGGHLDKAVTPDGMVDVMYEQETGKVRHIVSPRIDSRNTHGTGCTLSAAIAANLAKGAECVDAVQRGIRYVNEAIQTSYTVGQGAGPVNHAYALCKIDIVQPTLQNPYPFTEYLKSHTRGMWEQYTNHPFVEKAAMGTMDKNVFVQYLKQDYLYLKHYARANALAAFKSDSLREVSDMIEAMQTCVRESELHVEMCARWGITREEIEKAEESWNSVAYTRYIIDRGMSGDVLELLAAMYPCLLGYGEAALIAAKLKERREEDNPYWQWVSAYAGAEFQSAVAKGRQMIERLVQKEMVGGARLARLVATFNETVRLEISFWSTALELTS